MAEHQSVPERAAIVVRLHHGEGDCSKGQLQAMLWDIRESLFDCPLLYRGGSDWQKIMVKEIAADGSSKLLNDTLQNVKFSTTAWAPDSKVRRSPIYSRGRQYPAKF